MQHMAGIGIRLASTRTLRQVGSFMPTSIAGATVGPAPAGYLGLATRTALLAAVPTQTLRFAARPAIVRAYAQGDFQAIKMISGRPAGAAVGIALIAVIISAFAGEKVVSFAFGPNLAPAAPLMTVILLGVAIDAFGGVADEVLKMAGHERIVLIILSICVVVELLALIVASRFGVLAMAWVVTGYFASVSAATAIAVRIKLGVWLRPVVPQFPRI
jgi:O-antigen/teichoic acid export membrane protein